MRFVEGNICPMAGPCVCPTAWLQTGSTSGRKIAVLVPKKAPFLLPKKSVLARLGDLQVFLCEPTSAGWSQCGTSFSQFSFVVPAATAISRPLVVCEVQITVVD